MKRNILNLEGIVVLNAQQQKKISGGALLTKYEPGNTCQNATEIIPTGCPCSSGSRCARTYGNTVGFNTTGFGSREGVCSAGVCA